jgi:FeS assembly SUF system protein
MTMTHHKHSDPDTRTDVEDLKVNKIESPRDQPRQTFLPVLPDDEPAITEAYGGTGEAPAETIDPEALRERIVAQLKSIYDPEIPVNIYDLGLIYGFEIKDDGTVEIEMTLTAPGCPVAGSLVKEVADRVGTLPGVKQSHVELTWDPPWTRDRMSEECMLELGLL